MTFWMGKHGKRPAAWLVGLILAAVVFGVILLIFSALGYGDDPVVEGIALIAG
ncbi:MAG TPA: hypothetical protein VGB33_10725 [Acidimicrobiia bacterium]|jgi:hypothetical protein